MAKFGLYVVDETHRLAMKGYDETASQKWARTKLMLNGTPAGTTIHESNAYGIYAQDGIIKLNGDAIAKSSDGTENLDTSGADAYFGDTQLSTAGSCINITLDNYNSLRSGKVVDGYARYNPFAVYNIVEDIDEAGDPPVVDMGKFSGRNYINNEFEAHNELTDNTVLSVDTPDVVLKTTELIVKQGRKLVLEWWVDNKSHTSTDAVLVNGKPTYTIGDKFTVIIKHIGVGELLKRTTYAGEYRAEVGPFTEVGKTWISIQCIDESGCGSVEYFYEVYVEADVEEHLFEVTEDVLSQYHITPSTDLELDRDRLVVGYHNKRGFERLMKDVKEGVDIYGNPLSGAPYNGIRFYNANPNPSSVTDENNTSYFIDSHYNQVPYSDYINGDDSTVVLSRLNRFFFVRYSGSAVFIVNGDGTETKVTKSTVFPTVDSDGAFSGCRIRPGSSYNGYTVPSVDSAHDGIWDECDVVFDWIRHDGAHIYRTDDGKIRVPWHTELASDETPQAYKSVTDRTLRIRSMSAIKLGVASGTLKDTFPEGSGYYYAGATNDGNMTSGTRVSVMANIAAPMTIPDDFIVDFNYTTWHATNSTELYKFRMIGLYDNIHTTLRNGRILSDMTNKHIQDAILRTMYINTCWEGAGTIALAGAEFCVISNFDVGNVCGYNNSCGPIADFGKNIKDCIISRTDASSDIVKKASYSAIGYISVSGNTAGQFIKNGKDNNCVIKNRDGSSKFIDNTAVFKSHKMAYVDEHKTDICLVTNSRFVPEPGNTIRDYLVDDPTYGKYINADGSAVLKDEFLSLSDISYRYTKTKYGVGTVTTLTPHSSGFQLSNFKGAFSKARSGGKYHEVFIHFYRYSNGTYAYISSVKTVQHLKVMPPENATHFRVTGYSSCIDLSRANAVECLSGIDTPLDKIRIGNAVLRVGDITGELDVDIVFTDSSGNELTVTITLVTVPGNYDDAVSNFYLGGNGDTPKRNTKLHTFLISKYEFIDRTIWPITGIVQGSGYPKGGLSYNRCVELIGMLNDMNLVEGSFRLPTEAEWEYAARGGRDTHNEWDYPGANDISESTESYSKDNSETNIAWYSDNSGGGIHQKGKKKKNSLGIYDMAGNVSEFCSDYFGELPDDAELDNPTGPDTGTQHVVKGGSYLSSKEECKITARSGADPDDVQPQYGFRLVLDYNHDNDDPIMSYFAFRIRKVTVGCVFDHYVVHDTKSIALNGPSVNCTYKDCKFYNIQTIDGWLNITPALSDVEENCLLADGTSYIRCTALSGDVMIDADGNYVKPSEKGFRSSQSLLANPLGQHRLFFNGNSGIGLAGLFSRSIIENSRISRFTASHYIWYDNNYSSIIRNNQICGNSNSGGLVALYRDTAQAISNAKFRLTGTLRNTCDEHVPTSITLEECSWLLRSKTGDPNCNTVLDIKGMSYYDGSADSVTNNYEQTLNQQ